MCSMKNFTSHQFNLHEKARKTIIYNVNGETTMLAMGCDSFSEMVGVYEPEFLIFVEMFDSNANSIFMHPVAQSGEKDLESNMCEQIRKFLILMKNVSVTATAVEVLRITPEEWKIIKSYKNIGTFAEEFFEFRVA